MPKLTMDDTDWGLRIKVAKVRGKFQAQDFVAIMMVGTLTKTEVKTRVEERKLWWPDLASTFEESIALRSSCGCAVGELFSRKLLRSQNATSVPTDDRNWDRELYELCTTLLPAAVRNNDVAAAEKHYLRLLEIRNEDYE